MGRSLHIRLHAYAPDGTSLGMLPRPLGVDADFQHNDAGTLKVTYSRLALGGSILQRGLEQGLAVGFEVSDGGEWTEPYNARFVLTSRSRDAKDRSDTVTLNLMTYAWLLKKALLIDTSKLLADGDNKGKRPFYSANPGTIVKTMLDENRERGGVAQYVTAGFDTGKDSSGAAWSNVMTLYYDPGIDCFTALSNLAANGVCDWRTQGMTLNMWNADSAALCRDLSESIIIPLATQALESPEEETIEDLASHILVMGDGIDFTQDNNAAPTPWGKWELYSSQGGVSDEGTARLLMQSQLGQAARVRGQYTRSVLVTDVDALPLIDYAPGDWITAPTVSHGEKVRVQRVTISLSNQGLKAALILNDRLYDAQTRQAKRIQGITGGAVAGGAQGGRPAPAQDHRVPKAPEGLVLSSDAYVDDQGNALGVVYARWGEVTQATDGTAIDIDSYRVEWRYGDEADHWRFAGLTVDETISWGGVDCGRAVVVRVRAIPTYSDKPGEWSGTVSVTVESDVTPPSIPSMPVLESELGVVRVRSDGLNHVGGGFEPDTAYLAVGRSASNGNWTGVGRIPVGGMWTDIGLSMGQTYWYALRAVDRSGNASGWSQGASVRVASAVTQDELDGLADRVTDAVDAVGEQQKVVSQVQTDLNAAKQQITANKTLADTGIEQAKQAAQAAAQAAASAQTTADGRNRIFHDWQDPTVSDPSLKPVVGDLWYRYQRFWTTSQGEPDNSPSLCANFYTYAQGEPDNSPSVLVPLESEIVEVLVWDGDSWNTFTLVASDVIASGSVSAELVDAEFFHGRTIVGGTYTTEGENVVINDNGILFQDDAKTPKLSFARDSTGKWVLTVRDGIQSGGTITGSSLEGVTVTGSTVQTSGEDRRGVKITDAGLAAYDGAGAANTVIDATTGRITMNGALISQGGIVSPTITGGVITGALFRSSESDYPRFELSGTDLDMWDSARNHTVHLDGDGETSWLTGTFQTAVSGKRVQIDPDFHTSIVGDPDNTQTGVGIKFVPDGAYARAPYIGTEFEDSDRGLISTICLNGGMRTDGSGGANTGFGSFMRLGQYRNGGTESAEIYATTKADYLEQSADTSRREWYTALRMHNRSGNGSYAQLYAHKPGSRYANVYAWANDSNNSGRTYAGIEAHDPNGEVGIQACIDTGYLHLGGYLGGFTGRATVQALNWRWGNGMGHGQTAGPSTYTFGNPAKYGAYNGVANADVPFGSIFAHVCYTGSASRGQVIGFNAGTANYKGDVYCSVVSWLRA